VTSPAAGPARGARARELVDAERTRLDAAIRDLDGSVRGEGELGAQQAGETRELGTDVAAQEVDLALLATLRERRLAVDRASARIDAGTYGRSVDSGLPIPVERLEAEPLAERTVAEQAVVDDATA
jgi:DnaK suppressor protein